MKYLPKFAAFVAAVAMLMLASNVVRADDAAAAGSISGTVTGTDGKPAANITVRLFSAADLPQRGQKAKTEANQNTPAARPLAAQQAGRPKATKETTTNDKGEFTFADVAAGDYVIFAGARGTGMARDKVTVKAGEKATVSLTLKERTRGGKNAPAKE